MENSAEVAQAADTESVQTEVNSEVTENTETSQATEAPKEQPKAEDTPWPRKAVNAMSRRDREIGRLRAQLRELQAKEQTKQNTNTQPANAEPQEKDFATYGEFLQASTLYKLRQELAEAKKAEHTERTNETKSAERKRYVETKSQSIIEAAQKYARQLPDYQQVVQENHDIIDNFPEAIQDLFLEADDAALAFYNLAKDGTLATLAEMTPARAALAIAKAHKAPTPQRQTQAPRPMQGASGTGQSASNLGQIMKNPDALRKWIKS